MKIVVYEEGVRKDFTNHFLFGLHFVIRTTDVSTQTDPIHPHATKSSCPCKDDGRPKLLGSDFYGWEGDVSMEITRNTMVAYFMKKKVTG